MSTTSKVQRTVPLLRNVSVSSNTSRGLLLRSTSVHWRLFVKMLQMLGTQLPMTNSVATSLVHCLSHPIFGSFKITVHTHTRRSNASLRNTIFNFDLLWASNLTVHLLLLPLRILATGGIPLFARNITYLEPTLHLCCAYPPSLLKTLKITLLSPESVPSIYAR